MHAIGSWLVSWAVERRARPRLRLRQPAGHAGGLCGRPGQRHRCRDRLHRQRQERQDRRGRRLPGARQQRRERPGIHRRRSSTPSPSRPPRVRQSTAARRASPTLLSNAPAVVLPPDTGYDLKMANALYAAEAAVLGGQMSPADALAGHRPAAGPLATTAGRPSRRGRPARPHIRRAHPPMKPDRAITPVAVPGARPRRVRLRGAAADGAHRRLQLHRVERLRADDVRGPRQLRSRGLATRCSAARSCTSSSTSPRPSSWR